jgi:hypothetical protein
MRHTASSPIRIHTMPYDLTETEERQLATELASDLDTYIANELCDELYELAANVLLRHGADPGTDYGRDLIQDLANRIKITTR